MIGTIGNRVLGFGLGLILANILAPEYFGALAMITVFTGFAAQVLNFGLPSALICRKEVDEEHYMSAFWCNIVLSLGMGTAFYLAAPAIARFYVMPEEVLVWPARVMALVFLFEALQFVPWTILNKQLRFRALTIIVSISTLSGTILALIMALRGFGLWALVAEQVIGTGVNAALMIGFTRWRPRFRFNLKKLKELLRFGVNVTLGALLLRFGGNIDTLLIGKLQGASPVGVYNRCFMLMMLPRNTIVVSLVRVMSPMMAELHEEPEQVSRYFLRIFGIGFLLICPPMVMLALSADHVVNALWGPKWVGMIPLLPVMAMVGVVRLFGPMCRSVLLTQNRSGLTLLISGIVVFGNTAGIVIGLRWGLIGVAWGLLISEVVLLAPIARITLPFMKMPLLRPLQAIQGILGCTLLMALAMGAIRLALPEAWPLPPFALPEVLARRWSPLLNLLVLNASGGLLLLGLLWLFRVDMFTSLVRLIRGGGGMNIRQRLRENG